MRYSTPRASCGAASRMRSVTSATSVRVCSTVVMARPPSVPPPTVQLRVREGGGPSAAAECRHLPGTVSATG
jgi:hypothetical protein